jgi:ABC-type Zn uptake system ZnuABC Zn-binding protein ZnuA
MLAVLAACGDEETNDAGATATAEGTSAAGVTATSGEAGDELVVVASNSIIGSLTRQVAGDQATVIDLIPSGVDPHTYEPSVDDARNIAGADLALFNGLELDDNLVSFVEDAQAGVPVVVVTEGIELLPSGADDHGEGHEEHQDEHHQEGTPAAEEHHEHESGTAEAGDEHEHEHEGEGEAGHEHGEFDPHVWQDPIRAKVMVDNIAAALAEVDPDHADDYRANAEAYKERLDEVDAEIQALVDEIPDENRKIVTNHDALGYFADRYGFEVVGTVIPSTSTDAEPSAQEIAELTELIEAEQVQAIFAEELVDPKIAEQLANDTGVQIVTGIYTDQVGEPGTPAETLDGMLLENARKFHDALSN